ncbi:ATP synthase protein I [Zymomonas mobilis]|uniref:ATP synthase protein I n=2 Tax=Zymomonas TaxID=541 RepID=A0A542W0N1_ZYMMB|nr:AtpZ/AtpI family protein [Zymomonas mobilis]TQL17126.1 ATP synthase protein I [Zymomonas mobilis]
MVSNDSNKGLGPQDPRMAELEAMLATSRRDSESRQAKANKPAAKGFAQGNRVLTEMIAGPAGGGLIGWLFDRLIGTKPIFLIIFLLLGVCIAFRNVVRISREHPE